MYLVIYYILLLGVRRWEEYEEKVNFYFEDLKNKKICVNFLVVQEVCVENSGPALIKLYDYYNTQHESSVVSEKDTSKV